MYYSVGDKGWDLTGQTFDYNAYYGGNTLVQADAHKITDDPKFVDPGSGGNGMDTVNGYQLQATSPLIGAGIRINDNGGRIISATCYIMALPISVPTNTRAVFHQPGTCRIDRHRSETACQHTCRQSSYAKAAASTTFQTSSSGPIEHIIDNDYDTAWETETKPSFPNDITLDFGEQTLIANQLKLNTRYGKDLGITNFDLEYRNGSAWIPLRTNINLTWDLNTGANEIKSVEFPLTRFSQIRLKVHDGVNPTGRIALNELELYNNPELSKDMVTTTFATGQAQLLTSSTTI